MHANGNGGQIISRPRKGTQLWVVINRRDKSKFAESNAKLQNSNTSGKLAGMCLHLGQEKQNLQMVDIIRSPEPISRRCEHLRNKSIASLNVC